MGLIELIFHIKNGFFCPECGEEIGFDKVKEDLEKIMKEMKINKKSEEEIDAVKMVYFNKIATCSKCNGKMREIISIKNEGNINKLTIYNTDISPKDFDELKALIARQNILDYDSDKYIDPDLKEELEIKARLQNKNYTSPSLEK